MTVRVPEGTEIYIDRGAGAYELEYKAGPKHPDILVANARWMTVDGKDCFMNLIRNEEGKWTGRAVLAYDQKLFPNGPY